MLRSALVFAVAFAAISHKLAGEARAADGSEGKRRELARTFVAQMAAGQFDKAVEGFEPVMRGAMPADKLKTCWDGLTRQFGALRNATETTTEKSGPYEIVYVTCEFQRASLDAKAVFTSENRITGLFFVPSSRYKPPAYVDSTKFAEKEAQIGKGAWLLPCTLSLPKAPGPFPAVVLVHGSGPHDRDETIDTNRPFADLAHGLASRGIAVLRYEKRTKEHALLMAMSASSITVKEETVDDAAAAVDMLTAEKQIDAKRIFVLGHSLGGYLLPRIGKANAKIAGFISLAGSTRPMEDLLVEQTRYLVTLDGSSPQEAKKQVLQIEKQAALIKSPKLTAATQPSELPLGVPVNYWLDLRGYDPAKEAAALSKPMLILQGERDYQVTMDDFAGWKKSLGSRKDATFQYYPKLNHLFVAGEGKSKPAEYLQPGNVAKEVIDDIAKWIAGH